MPQGEFNIVSAIRVPSLRLELIEQQSSGPFRRMYRLDTPSLAYFPPTAREPASGCFGIPSAHRDFYPLGAAVIIPQNVPFHVVSPGFHRRDFLVCHFEKAAFQAINGFNAPPHTPMLAAYRDVREPHVLGALSHLLDELRCSKPWRDSIVGGYGSVLMGELGRYLTRARDGAAVPLGMLAQWQLLRINKRIADETRPRPDLEELAALCGIGRRHLMRCFKTTCGMTVRDYIDRANFARAARLLSNTDLQLKGIAKRLGYCDQASFSSAFRRHFGETPSAYRMRSQSNNAL